MRDHLVAFQPEMVAAIQWPAPDIRKRETRRLRPRAISPGDRVGVREALVRGSDGMAHYARGGGGPLRDGGPVRWPWKPVTLGAMYCPRWAVRTWGTVVDVRIEPLDAIDDAAAVREGMLVLAHLPWSGRKWFAAYRLAVQGAPPREIFQACWAGLHGAWAPEAQVQVIRWT